jgi:NTP pyrophosphatase (non-canonical NTP hydrolase)
MNRDKAYTLYTTAEECNEVSQNIMKVLRFGLDTIYPADGQESNRQKLEEEMGQLMFCLNHLISDLDLSEDNIMEAYNQKANTWLKWKAYYVN